jgi:hypothetical protein
MGSRRIRVARTLAVCVLILPAACSDESTKGEDDVPSASTTPSGPSTKLSDADIAEATTAVKDNWETCISAVGASSSTATVEPIDDTTTGRPVDKGNRPVVVHVQWDEKEADFLVALDGQLTGAALFGNVSKALVAAAKAAGGDC